MMICKPIITSKGLTSMLCSCLQIGFPKQWNTWVDLVKTMSNGKIDYSESDQRIYIQYKKQYIIEAKLPVCIQMLTLTYMQLTHNTAYNVLLTSLHTLLKKSAVAKRNFLSRRLLSFECIKFLRSHFLGRKDNLN